jgi:hypothetical protein
VISHNLVLIIQALGANSVYAVHIDNGFMRKNESQQVVDSLASLGLKLTGKIQLYAFFEQLSYGVIGFRIELHASFLLTSFILFVSGKRQSYILQC